MLHVPHLVNDLAIILVVAAVVTFIFKVIRQPVVLGYILAGFLVSPHIDFLPTVTDEKAIRVWAEIGVIFLLFGLGLEFSFKKLRSVGGTASITGAVEITFMLTIGYFTGKLLGWNEMDSLFLGGILSISSTTIIIRAFDELGMKTKQFASVVLGVLIVEDLVAILLLVLLSTIAVTQQFEGAQLIQSSMKLMFFITLWFVAGVFVIPSLLRKFKSHLNNEFLLIFAVGLCLMMVIFATQVGFSPALGAFVTGSILAETGEGKRVENLIQPMKDFFGAIFFVSVGMLINPKILVEHWQSALILTLVLMMGKIFSCTLGSLIAGQSLRNSFQTGFSLAQIGEFSFIIATLGLTLKVTSDFLYPLAVAVSVITAFTTPYLIKASGPLADSLERILPKKITLFIRRYSSSTQAFTVSHELRDVFRNSLAKIALLGIIIIAITLLSKQFSLQFLYLHFESKKSVASMAFIGTILLSAPFYWALMWGSFSSHEELVLSPRSTFFLIMLRVVRFIIAVGLFTFQVSTFLPGIIAILVIFALLAALYLKYPQHLSEVYGWFEGNLVKNLSTNEKKNLLLPWDAHLASYDIPANAVYVGQSLEKLRIREKFGVTVVLIERGKKAIKAPSRQEVLFPNDRLSVIGNDEQLNKFKDYINSTLQGEDDFKVSDYGLKACVLSEESRFLGKTIRNSGIREETEGLVVGIERAGRRILNPDSVISLEVGDVLWIVGNKEKLKQLF